MDQLNLTKKQIITLTVTIILTISIGIGVYLVQVQHIFKSQASTEALKGVTRTDTQAQVNCTGEPGSATCTTDANEVWVELEPDFFEKQEK